MPLRFPAVQSRSCRSAFGRFLPVLRSTRQQPPAKRLTQTNAPSQPCALNTIHQEIERLPNGCRQLAVRLLSGVDPALLWDVLTDYEGLSRFIPNLTSSRVVQRSGRLITLDQVGQQILFGVNFSARVQLELTESPESGCLSFRMLKGDFRRFEGLWQVATVEAGTSLLYSLTVQGCLGMPVHLIEQRLRYDLFTNLRAVQKEAESRR